MKKTPKKKRKLSPSEIASKNKKLIQKLRAENIRLRRENAYLKYICAQYEPFEEEKTPEEQKALAERATNADVLHAKNYFAYLLARFRRSRVFRVFDRLRLLLKRFQWARKLWLLIVAVVTVLGFGAKILVIVGILAVFLPIALLLSAAIGIYGYFLYRKRKLAFDCLFGGDDRKDKIYVVFIPKNGMNGYFFRTSDELAEKGKVLVVCRSLKECRYASMTRMKANVYKIHVSIYFSFVRRLPPERLVKIYL